MFTSISLTNFKCFARETTFPLSKINLLTGINGRGKSSFLQALLLFKQSVEKDKYTNCLYLNGDYVKLHTYNDVKNRAAEENEILGFSFEINSFLKISYALNNFHTKDATILEIQKGICFNQIEQQSVSFNNNFFGELPIL